MSTGKIGDINKMEVLFSRPTLMPTLMYIQHVNNVFDITRAAGYSNMTILNNLKILLENGFIKKEMIGNKFLISYTELGHKFNFHLKHLNELYIKSML